MGIAMLGSWSCAQKSAKLQKSVVPPDKTLFETGSDYLKKSQYIKARLAFQTLINTYPDSDMAAESYFAIADSFYDEGGTENLLQAEDQYKNYIVFFPTSPKAVDAQMKIISINMKQMRSPDRDPQYSYKALQEIKKMLEKWPDSDYAPIAKQYQMEVEENIALGDLGVGQFYADKGNIAGAKGRFKTIIDNYQFFTGLDDVYLRYAGILEKSNNQDEAAIYYGRIVSGYPFSKKAEEAKQRLVALGKPVPAVDTELAASNQARLKAPEGFSPLKPLIDFGKALGFVGPPDRYEAAKKSVEEDKAKAAEAAGKAGEGDQKNGDILIQTTLRQSADGKIQDSTTLGAADQGGSQQNNEPKKKVLRKKKNFKKAE
jgi:outer membrane assembly lipoprotein YfiO